MVWAWSFGHFWQPFQRFLCIIARCHVPKDYFVIFSFLEKFYHFGQTFCEINVSFDSFNSLTVPCMETPVLNTHQTNSFGSILSAVLYFTASGVLSVKIPSSGMDSIHFWQDAIWKCKILLIIHHNHFLVTKMFAKKNSAATRSWFSVLRNFDSFFVDDIFFFKIRRTVECDVVSWPQVVTTLPRGFWYSATHFALLCCQQRVVLQFSTSLLRIVNHFHSLWWSDR
jgi:hypothetical protein